MPARPYDDKPLFFILCLVGVILGFMLSATIQALGAPSSGWWDILCLLAMAFIVALVYSKMEQR